MRILLYDTLWIMLGYETGIRENMPCLVVLPPYHQSPGENMGHKLSKGVPASHYQNVCPWASPRVILYKNGENDSCYFTSGCES